MALQVYNTLSRQKEPFVPVHEGRVNIYVCGPTVYGPTHIGHAKSYVSFDVIVRYLRYRYGERNVLYVQNLTDVGHLLDTGEDRILKGAARDRRQPMEVAEAYTRSYFADMDALRVMRPNISPRASAHIVEQIELIKVLLEKGYAYERDGNVYFSVEKFPEYGKLSGQKVEMLQDAVRIEADPHKRHPADFHLWRKAAPEHIMRWPSPWGEGYPGWHIECSVMSTKYLGQPFDIHGGGLENRFPHHECEIAQSEAATGVPFAKYWLHNNMVTQRGEEMHRSAGNAFNLQDLFKSYDPLAIRFFIISTHYRSPLDFSEAALESAKGGLARLQGAVRAVRSRLPGAPAGAIDPSAAAKIAEHRARFVAEMDDDFNTPNAIADLFDFTKGVNNYLAANAQATRDTLQAIDDLYRELGERILGLIPDGIGSDEGAGLAKPLIEMLLQTRQELRQVKQFALADKVRDDLNRLGVIVEDGASGSTWRLA
ncbi:MAG: cysteine--tRNA ligase [Chloroflexi bacterium]|nr:cysteine--tRNA ligase [Chloroflexota bacterium]